MVVVSNQAEDREAGEEEDTGVATVAEVSRKECTLADSSSKNNK